MDEHELWHSSTDVEYLQAEVQAARNGQDAAKGLADWWEAQAAFFKEQVECYETKLCHYQIGFAIALFVFVIAAFFAGWFFS
jgi:hypothetical protein